MFLKKTITLLTLIFYCNAILGNPVAYAIGDSGPISIDIEPLPSLEQGLVKGYKVSIASALPSFSNEALSETQTIKPHFSTDITRNEAGAACFQTLGPWENVRQEHSKFLNAFKFSLQSESLSVIYDAEEESGLKAWLNFKLTPQGEINIGDTLIYHPLYLRTNGLVTLAQNASIAAPGIHIKASQIQQNSPLIAAEKVNFETESFQASLGSRLLSLSQLKFKAGSFMNEGQFYFLGRKNKPHTLEIDHFHNKRKGHFIVGPMRLNGRVFNALPRLILKGETFTNEGIIKVPYFRARFNQAFQNKGEFKGKTIQFQGKASFINEGLVEALKKLSFQTLDFKNIYQLTSREIFIEGETFTNEGSVRTLRGRIKNHKFFENKGNITAENRLFLETYEGINQGVVLSQEGPLTVKGGTFTNTLTGDLRSLKDCFLELSAFASESPLYAEKLYITSSLTNFIKQAEAFHVSSVCLDLGEKGYEHTTPLLWKGGLELLLKGGVFRLMASLSAQKELIYRMPHSAFIVGQEGKELVHSFSQESYLTLEAQTVDVIRGGLFGEKSLIIQSEGPIQIGRSVAADVVDYANYQGTHSCGYKKYTSNGSFLGTNGALEALTTKGDIFLNHSSLYAGSHLSFAALNPIKILGGSIYGSGNGLFRTPTLALEMTSVTTYFGFNGPGYFDGRHIRATSNQPIISFLGEADLTHVSTLNNVGGQFTARSLKGAPRQQLSNVTELSGSRPKRGNFGWGGMAPGGKSYVATLSTSNSIVFPVDAVIQNQGGVYQSNEIIGKEINLFQNKVLHNAKPGISNRYKTFVDLLDYQRTSGLFESKPDSSYLLEPVFSAPIPEFSPPVILGDAFNQNRGSYLSIHPLLEVQLLEQALNDVLLRGYLTPDMPRGMEGLKILRSNAREYLQEIGLLTDGSDTPPSSESQVIGPLSIPKSKVEKFLKPALFYQEAPIEGNSKKALMPVLYLPPSYQDALLAIQEGVFKAHHKMILQGKTFDSTGVEYGSQLLSLDFDSLTKGKRQTIDHVPVTKKTTRSYVGVSKTSKSTQMMQVVTTQPGSGIWGTAPEGEFHFKARQAHLKGAEVKAGTAFVDVKKLTSSPVIDTRIEESSSKASGFMSSKSMTTASLIPTILGTEFQTQSGIYGQLGELNVSGTTFLTLTNDIEFYIEEDAHLHAALKHFSLGEKVAGDGWTITTYKSSHTTGRPCAFIALDGNVKLMIEGNLWAHAPEWYGRTIEVSAKRIYQWAQTLESSVTSNTQGFQNVTTYINQNREETHESLLRPVISSEEGAFFTAREGDNILQAPLVQGDLFLEAPQGSARLESVEAKHTVTQTTSVLGGSFFGSTSLGHLFKGEPGAALQAMGHEFPLYEALHTLAQGAGTPAEAAKKSVHSLYAGYKTLKELGQAGSLKNYLIDKLATFSFTFGTSKSSSFWTHAEVPTVLTQSAVGISAKEKAVVEGLTGTLTDMYLRGKSLALLPAEERHTADFEDFKGSIGVNPFALSFSISGSQSTSQEKGHRPVHLPLTILNTLTLLGEEDIAFNTYIDCLHSFIQSKRLIIDTPQETYNQSSFSAQGNISLSPASVSGGFSGSQGSSKRRWASQAAGLHSQATSYIDIDNDTILKGAVLLLGEQAEPILAVNPASNQPCSFYEFQMPADGDCAFHALGISRKKAVEQLLRASSAPNIRKLVAPEILAALLEGTFKLEGEWAAAFKLLQEQEAHAYKSLNDEINRLKSLKGLEGDAALTTLVGLQATDQFAPEDFTSLQSLIDLHAESHQALTHFLSGEELYKTFIIQTLALNQNWLSFIYSTHEKVTTSLDALALLNGLSVTVWGKTGADSLTPLHQTEDAPNATPRHILFTAAGKVGGVNPLQANHFNLLDTSPGLLKTPVLNFEDVQNVDQSAYTSLGVSDISVVGAVAAFMEAERRTHDRRGVHRATVAPGYKIETDSNIGGLNRNPAQSFEITQDDSSHFWIGAPLVRDWNQAKAEVMKGFEVLRQEFGPKPAKKPVPLKTSLEEQAEKDALEAQQQEIAEPEEESSTKAKVKGKQPNKLSEAEIILKVGKVFVQRVQQLFDQIAKKAKIYLSPEKIEEYGHKILANMAEFYKYWSQEGLQVVEAWNQALQQTAVNINVYLKECLKEPALRLSDGPLDPTEILHFVPQLIGTFVTGLILQKVIKEELSSDKKSAKPSTAGISHSATAMPPHDPDNEPEWRRDDKGKEKEKKVDNKKIEEIRERVVRNHYMKPEEAKELGFRGSRIRDIDTNPITRNIEANTELQGNLNDAQNLMNNIKQEFSKTREILPKDPKVTLQTTGRSRIAFKDGSSIQIRLENASRSGHIKLEINDTVKNIYEKITFKN